MGVCRLLRFAPAIIWERDCSSQRWFQPTVFRNRNRNVLLTLSVTCSLLRISSKNQLGIGVEPDKNCCCKVELVAVLIAAPVRFNGNKGLYAPGARLAPKHTKIEFNQRAYLDCLASCGFRKL